MTERRRNGEIETRAYLDPELRMEDNGGTTCTIIGYGSTTGNASRIVDQWGAFDEVIMPGAFRNAIPNSSAVLQVNHEGIALARVPTTMTLAEDNIGLRFEATLDTRSAAATDLLVALERKDVRACSFGFRLKPGDDEWNTAQTSRKIHRVSEIIDCSCVNWPANSGTFVNIEGRSVSFAQPISGSMRPSGPRTTHEQLGRELAELRRRKRERWGQELEDLHLSIEARAGYSAKARAAMAKTGEAMPDGSFPVKTATDLQNAVHMVGLASNPKPAVRRHLMRRAKALNLAHLIPSTWAADGTTK